MKQQKKRMIIIISSLLILLSVVSGIFFMTLNRFPKQLLITNERNDLGIENFQEYEKEGGIYYVYNKPDSSYETLTQLVDKLISENKEASTAETSLVFDWNANKVLDRYLNFQFYTKVDETIETVSNYVIDTQDDTLFNPKDTFTSDALSKFKIANNGKLTLKENAFIVGDETISEDMIPEYIKNEYGAFKPKPKPPVNPDTPFVPDRKIVAFTFDDGPSKTVTQNVMTTAEKFNAKVTFFALGSRIEQYPDIAKEIVTRGHQLASHSFDHPDLTTLSKENQLSQITRTENLVKEVAGYTKEVMVRPPYGANNPSLLSNAPRMYINWSVDTLDWKSRDAQSVCNSIVNDTKPGDIILMHDLYESTAAGFECGIEKLAQEGYEFVTVDELLIEYRRSFDRGKVYTKGTR